MRSSVTIVDIARESGCSTATVSRALAGSKSILPETRERVLRVAQKYNYRPNAMAAALSQKRSGMLGLVMPQRENPFYASIFFAIEQEALQHGYSILLYQLPRGRMFDRALSDMLISKRMEGLILLSDVTDAVSRSSVVSFANTMRKMIPFALIHSLPGRGGNVFHTISPDYSACAATAVRHFRKLGHTRIALVGGVGALGDEISRESGYVNAMRELGLDAGRYQMYSGETPEAGAQSLEALLCLPEPPTAVVAYNDMVALGVLRQADAAGLRVPEDLAVIGCDNTFFSAYTHPPLTTFDLSLGEVGQFAVRLLIDEINGKTSEVRRKIFQPTLIVRESCGYRRALAE